MDQYLIGGNMESERDDNRLSQNRDDNDLFIAQLIHEVNNIREVSDYFQIHI